MGKETLGDRGKSVRYLSAAKYDIVQIVYIIFRLYGSINNKPYVTKHNLEKQSTIKNVPLWTLIGQLTVVCIKWDSLSKWDDIFIETYIHYIYSNLYKYVEYIKQSNSKSIPNCLFPNITVI